MLNSMLFEEYGFVLKDEIKERYHEIVDYHLSFWRVDSDFDEYFRSFFPSGFIDRDREKAKRIIRDLEVIVDSPVIRRKLAPIYCFVMSNMIEVWYTQSIDWEIDILPERVEEYIKDLERKLPDEETERKIDNIRDWFTSDCACLEDFCVAYDAELFTESIAEIIADRFLEDPGYLEGLETLGFQFEDLLDLLPNDLYYSVIKAHESNVDLTNLLLIACERLCNNSLDFKDLDEDGLNRRVRDTLYDHGYEILDQSQQGIGETGKDVGSLDILIKQNGLNVAIYEGLIHKDKKYLLAHIDKAVGRYNPSGCRSVYIGEYYKNKQFDLAWDNTVKHLRQMFQGVEVDTEREGVRLFRFVLRNIVIWVFGLNMYCELK